MARDMIQEAPTTEDCSAVRERWIAELRRQGHRQCEHIFVLGGTVCALGLLREVSGQRASIRDSVDSVGALAGLAGWQAWEITYRNDGTDGFGKHTFMQIADVVESWFR